MLRGIWTRIWGKGGEAVITPGVATRSSWAQLAGWLVAGLLGSAIGFGEQTSRCELRGVAVDSSPSTVDIVRLVDVGGRGFFCLSFAVLEVETVSKQFNE